MQTTNCREAHIKSKSAYQTLPDCWDEFLPHGTRVPKKNTNEDGDEDKEPDIGRRSRIGEPKMEKDSKK